MSSDVKISSNENLPHFIYKVPYEPGFSEELLVKPAIDGNQLKGMWALAQVEKVMCECLLNDTKLLQELKDFDLLVYEGAALCAVLLGEHLEIPRVVIAPGPPNAAFAPFHMIPTPVSYVPQQLTGFSCNMTFIERVINLGVYYAGQLLLKVMFAQSVIPLKTKFHIKPEISYEDAVTNVELVIILADFALEFPQPLLPGIAIKIWNVTNLCRIVIWQSRLCSLYCRIGFRSLRVAAPSPRQRSSLSLSPFFLCRGEGSATRRLSFSWRQEKLSGTV